MSLNLENSTFSKQNKELNNKKNILQKEEEN